MGTINYGTSDYITLGIKPYDIDDFYNDDCFVREARAEVAEYGGTVDDDYIYQLINDYYDDDRTNAECIINKYNLHYYHIAIKPGYYEGLYLDIENNYSVAYDDYTDRREAQKELTQLKQCLIELAGCGYCEVWPGWCTHYMDYATTVKTIEKVIKAMRAEVKTIPTWRQYEKGVA